MCVLIKLYLSIRAVTGCLDVRASGARRDVRGRPAEWRGPPGG